MQPMIYLFILLRRPCQLHIICIIICQSGHLWIDGTTQHGKKPAAE